MCTTASMHTLIDEASGAVVAISRRKALIGIQVHPDGGACIWILRAEMHRSRPGYRSGIRFACLACSHSRSRSHCVCSWQSRLSLSLSLSLGGFEFMDTDPTSISRFAILSPMRIMALVSWNPSLRMCPCCRSIVPDLLFRRCRNYKIKIKTPLKGLFPTLGIFYFKKYNFVGSVIEKRHCARDRGLTSLLASLEETVSYKLIVCKKGVQL